MASPNVATLDISYEYKRSDGAQLPISYAYVQTDFQTASLGMSYGYEDVSTGVCLQLVGHWSYETQAICNRMPAWHVARSETGHATNFQKMINPFGMIMEDLFGQMAYARSNFYINTADLSQLDHVYRGDIPFSLPQAKEKSSNLLWNSDFSLKAVGREGLPAGWSSLPGISTASISNTGVDDSVLGNNAVFIAADAGEIGYLRQVVHQELEGNEDLTISAWINVPLDTGLITPDPEDRTLSAMRLSVIYADGTSEMTGIALPSSTDGQWKRVSGTISLTQPVYKAACTFMLDARSEIREHVLGIDAVKMELGSHATKWADHPSDGPPWLTVVDSERRGPIDVHFLESTGSDSFLIDNASHSFNTSSKRRLSYVEATSDFSRNSIPTSVASVETLSASDTVPTVFATKVRGVYREAREKRSWKTLLRVDPSNSDRIQIYLQGPEDIIETYKLAEWGIHYAQPGTYDIPVNRYPSSTYSMEIRDLSFFNEKIWALCQETFRGNIYYTIKIVDPNSFRNFDYVEVVNDVTLPLSSTEGFDAMETASGNFTMAHVDGDPRKLLLVSGSNNIVVTLNYDYYMVSEELGQVLTRHQYTGDLVTT